MPADLPAPTASVETIAGFGGSRLHPRGPSPPPCCWPAILGKPVLVEGSAGVGKTELALSTARWLSLPLIRMQCYEGLDESKALYEWKYGKQLLYTQLLKDKINEVLGETGDLTDALGRLANFSDMFSPSNSWSRSPCCKPCASRKARSC